MKYADLPTWARTAACLLCLTSAAQADPPSEEAPPPPATPAEPAEAAEAPPPEGEDAAEDEEDEAIVIGGDDEGVVITDEDAAGGELVILGNPDEMAKMGGSAHTIDKEFLETFEFDDVHRALAVVPGSFVRDEDGFGLRPNIGLRGVSPERSAKITLLEDGVLFGPAPYSAPAAYYFPILTRMVQVEVFKGPAAIQHGPQTVAGAINLVTRGVPGVRDGHKGQIDVSGGQYMTAKGHGWYGYGDKHWGVLVEGVHLRSDGFKELDGGGETGFEKSEAMLKLRLNTAPGAHIFHRLDVKLGYADEISHETYLGLTDADFDANPLRRYAASQKGLMDWSRTEAEVRYRLLVGESFDLKVTAYRHDFTRAWTKLNHMESVSNLRDLLRNPDQGQNAVLYDVLTGAQDSTGLNDGLLIGTNDRTFVSQGVQMNGEWSIGGGWLSQKLAFGARLHSDKIDRDHTEDRYLMQSGRLVADANATTLTTTDNTGSTDAIALHALDKITLGDQVFLTPGVRMEIISSTYEDRLSGEVVEDDYSVVLPGVGAFWQATDHFGLLAGVHKGFSAKSPGADPSVGVEEAINYEAGSRFSFLGARGELIGFFSDYSNLVGNCTFSSGCDNNEDQFSGGEVDVYGLEALLEKDFALGAGYTLDTKLTYTLTVTEFKTSFDAGDPLFGDTVEKGDHLPYLPMHQGQLSLGLIHEIWGVNTLTHFVSESLDEAGLPDDDDVLKIDGRVTLDVAAYYRPYAAGRIYLRANNVTDSQYIASRRPYGARPGRPMMIVGGFKHTF